MNAPPFLSPNVTVVSRSRRMGAILRPWSTLLPFIGLLGQGAHSDFVVLGLLAATMILFFFFFFLWNLYWVRSPRVSGTLSATREGIFVDGQMILSRSAMTQGYAVRVGNRAQVSLESASKTHDIDLPPDANPGVLLEALGLDPEHNAASFTVLAGGMRREMQCVIAALALPFTLTLLHLIARHLAWASRSGLTEVALPFAAGLALVLIATFRRTLTVGTDGILVRAAWGAGRFVPFDRITDVRVAKDDLLVTLRGKASPLRLGTRLRLRRATLQEEPLSQTIARRVDFARRAAPVQATSSRTALHTLLARSERTPRAWQQALEGAPADRSSFRSPATSVESLWDAFEDPTEAAEVRVGALLALRVEMDAHGRERALATARASACPAVRGVAEAVARGDVPAVDASVGSMIPIGGGAAVTRRRGVASSAGVRIAKIERGPRLIAEEEERVEGDQAENLDRTKAR